MDFTDEKVRVKQHVEIVPGQSGAPRHLPGLVSRRPTTATLPQKVGLRFMLDTYIGANDGVPFTAPASRALSTI